MSLLARGPLAFQTSADLADDAAELSRLEARLPPLLSIIAGMVDFTGFFTLGHIFTAHVTGNIVLAAVVAVDGGSFHWAQLLAIPVFMLALATVWLIAQASGRHGSNLARLLLRVQFLVLAALLIFSVIVKPGQDILRESASRLGRFGSAIAPIGSSRWVFTLWLRSRLDFGVPRRTEQNHNACLASALSLERNHQAPAYLSAR